MVIGNDLLPYVTREGWSFYDLFITTYFHLLWWKGTFVMEQSTLIANVIG